MSFVVHRVAKSAARYTDAGGREKCGYCRFFVAPRTCGKVVGPVSPAGWCKYFSRQVAQQYSGAGITGGGGPPGMTLDLNFMSSGNMPPGVTFTRASTATYTDASGVIQTAAINQPRWDYTGGSLRGLLIEEARTNIWLQSADASNAAWNKLGVTAAAPVVTANQTTAPDGTLTAARVVYPAVSAGGSLSQLHQILNLAVPNAAQTFSVYLKGAVGGEQTYLNVNSAGTYSRVRVTLTTAWQRFALTTPVLPGGGYVFVIGTDLGDAGQSSTPAQTIFVWGAQAEGGALSSYIPTLAANVTRSADLAAMPFTPAASGTYAARFIPAGVASSLPVIISGNAGSPVMAIGADSRLVAQVRSGASVFSGVAPAMTFNVVNKTAFGWLTGASKAAVNGTLLGASAVALTVTGTSMQLGSDGVTPGNNAINGALQAVQGWPRQLSDAEMQQVTT
jgi:hypothetical protein